MSTKKQDGFSKGCEILGTAANASCKTLPMIRFILPNKVKTRKP